MGTWLHRWDTNKRLAQTWATPCWTMFKLLSITFSFAVSHMMDKTLACLAFNLYERESTPYRVLQPSQGLSTETNSILSLPDWHLVTWPQVINQSCVKDNYHTFPTNTSDFPPNLIKVNSLHLQAPCCTYATQSVLPVTRYPEFPLDMCPLCHGSDPVLLRRPAVPCCILSPPRRSTMDSWRLCY